MRVDEFVIRGVRVRNVEQDFSGEVSGWHGCEDLDRMDSRGCVDHCVCVQNGIGDSGDGKRTSNTVGTCRPGTESDLVSILLPCRSETEGDEAGADY